MNLTLYQKLQALEIQLIKEALVQTPNMTRAAQILGIPRTTLLMKIQKLGIEKRPETRVGRPSPNGPYAETN